jgi:uncharacterized protein (DUF2141 family)
MAKIKNMRRPAILVAVICVLASTYLFPVAGVAPPVEKMPASQQKVELAVSGLSRQACPVLAAVFTNADGFPKVEFASSTTRHDSDGQATELQLELLLPKQGRAAIAVFQDLDANGVLTKNALGLPVEPYGFSRNARGTFGPPKFNAAALELSNLTEKLEVKVR